MKSAARPLHALEEGSVDVGRWSGEVYIKMNKDYYSTLGLKPSVSSEEIKKTYRRLAMQYHPDRNGDSIESEERLKEINEAYQVLGDEEKRRHYDLQCQQPFRDTTFRDDVSYEKNMADDLITVVSRFFQGSFDRKRTGCFRGRGLGRRGGCRRWKRRSF